MKYHVCFSDIINGHQLYVTDQCWGQCMPSGLRSIMSRVVPRVALECHHCACATLTTHEHIVWPLAGNGKQIFIDRIKLSWYWLHNNILSPLITCNIFLWRNSVLQCKTSWIICFPTCGNGHHTRPLCWYRGGLPSPTRVDTRAVLFAESGNRVATRVINERDQREEHCPETRH